MVPYFDCTILIILNHSIVAISVTEDHWHRDLGRVDARSRGDPTSERPNHSEAEGDGVKRLAYTACPENMFWLQYCNRYKWWCDNVWYVIYLYIYMICCVNLFVFNDVFCSSLEVISRYSLCYYQHSCPPSPGRCWCEAWSTLQGWF